MPKHLPFWNEAAEPGLDGLVRAAPSARGVDANAFAAFLDDVDAAGLELHATMLWRDGAVVAEGWHWPYGPQRVRMMHSVTKSITACAIGLLVAEGRLSLNDPVAQFFPAETKDAQASFGRMTVEHLLSMRTGHGAEVSGAVWRGIETSWIAEFFRIPLKHEPGTVYVYSSAASYILAAIVTRISGETIREYLEPRLFAPLGIRSLRWDLGPDGYNPGGNGISMTIADALKIGILHAQQGLWHGRQVLPRAWVDQATQCQGSPTYGYHWVVGDGYYAALGVFVQMVAVWPRAKAVLAIAAAMEDSSVLLPHLQRHFPGLFDQPGSETADLALAERLADWSSAPVLASRPHDAEPTIDGTRWLVEPNPMGMLTLAFETSTSEIRLTIEDAYGAHLLVVAMDGWREAPSDIPGTTLHHGYPLLGTPIVAGARWLSSNRLEMVWHFVETAFRDTVTFRFDQNRVAFDRAVNINSGARAWPTLTAIRQQGA